MTYSDLLPPLSADEFEALKADIAERGQQQPILTDDGGKVIDGAHRLKACKQLGCEPWIVVRSLLTESEKEAMAIAVNVRRRQLSVTARRELVDELRRLGKSVRTIAAETGFPRSTVSDDLQVSGSGHLPGDPPGSPERIGGSDGKTYPATRPAVRAETGQRAQSDSPPSPAAAAELAPTVSPRLSAPQFEPIEIDPDALYWLRSIGPRVQLLAQALADGTLTEIVRDLDDHDQAELSRGVSAALEILPRIRALLDGEVAQ